MNTREMGKDYLARAKRCLAEKDDFHRVLREHRERNE